MNDIINVNRFRLLVRRQWAENKKLYFLLWGVISIASVAIDLFADKNGENLGYFLLILCFGGCVMVPTLFSRWTDFGRSSFFLLLPASSTEKFLCGLLYCLILFIPLYSLNFLFLSHIATYLAILLFPNNLVSFSSIPWSAIKEIASFPNLYIVALLAFLFTQSLFMIIAIRFRKQQVLIFLLILLSIVMVHNTGMQILMSNLLHIPAGTRMTPGFLIFFDPGFGYEGSTGNQAVSEYFAFIKPVRNLNSLTWFVVFAILYITALFKLKEREL